MGCLCSDGDSDSYTGTRDERSPLTGRRHRSSNSNFDCDSDSENSEQSATSDLPAGWNILRCLLISAKCFRLARACRTRQQCDSKLPILLASDWRAEHDDGKCNFIKLAGPGLLASERTGEREADSEGPSF